MAPRILFTGFKPFGSVSLNPTEQLIIRLQDAAFSLESASPIEAVVLDTVYSRCEAQFSEAVYRFKPDFVLSFGLSYRTDSLQLERVGLNIDDAAIPDTQADHRSGQKIAEDGPVAYWATLPLDRLYQALQTAGLPVRYSNHAGAYVCNHLLYYGLHLAQREPLGYRMGFIHVPPLPEQLSEAEQASRPGMPLNSLWQAVQVCVAALNESS